MHRDRLAEAHKVDRQKGLTRDQIQEVKIFIVQCESRCHFSEEPLSTMRLVLQVTPRHALTPKV